LKQLYSYNGIRPKLHESVFVAPGAKLIGDITAGEGSSFWYNVTVRADTNPVIVGKCSNVQDGTVIHEDSGRGSGVPGGLPTIIGDYVTVGHNAILHACTIEDYCLIGMGSIILDGSVIGRGSVVGAGALVTKGSVIPPMSLVLGVPAKVVRTLDEDSLKVRDVQATHYREEAAAHLASILADEAEDAE
jgi:carbonic anhydrase/acetyltransferase-like protein (isoleucine patch superfamily)